MLVHAENVTHTFFITKASVPDYVASFELFYQIKGQYVRRKPLSMSLDAGYDYSHVYEIIMNDL